MSPDARLVLCRTAHPHYAPRPLHGHADMLTVFLTLLQLLGDTDKALATLRARSLLVRLVQSIPTPAVSAVGGPHGLLNITRLLAAQDLAKGKAPASFGSVSDDGGNDADQASVGSVAGDQDNEPVLPRRCSKLVYKPPSDQDSLLKVMLAGLADGVCINICLLLAVCHTYLHECSNRLQ